MSREPLSPATQNAPLQLNWVGFVGGQPAIRWVRIAAMLLLVSLVNLAAARAVSWYSDMPFRPAGAVIMSLALAAYLTLAVELQRQRLLTGRWSFRFHLSTLLLLMLIACLTFATMGYELRQTQRASVAASSLQTELEEVMRGGKAYLGAQAGAPITCQVTRADFADADLARLIERSSRDGKSQLSTLFLDATSITQPGVRQFTSCQQLRYLSLPPLALDDEAMEALVGCKKLDFLMLDEKLLSDAQIARLQAALPRLRLNGNTWHEWAARRKSAQK